MNTEESVDGKELVIRIRNEEWEIQGNEQQGIIDDWPVNCKWKLIGSVQYAIQRQSATRPIGNQTEVPTRPDECADYKPATRRSENNEANSNRLIAR